MKNWFIFDIESGGLDSNKSPVLSISARQGASSTSFYARPSAGSYVSEWARKQVWNPISKRKDLLSEEQALTNFTSLLESNKGATFAGWNIGVDQEGAAGFDIQYLLTRASKYKDLQPRLQSAFSNVNIRDIGQEKAYELSKALYGHRQVIDENLWRSLESYRNVGLAFEKQGYTQAEAAAEAARSEYRISGWKQEDLYGLLTGKTYAAHASETDIQALQEMADLRIPGTRKFAEQWNKIAVQRSVTSSIFSGTPEWGEQATHYATNIARAQKWGISNIEEIIAQEAEKRGASVEDLIKGKGFQDFLHGAEEVGGAGGKTPRLLTQIGKFAKKHPLAIGVGGVLGFAYLTKPLNFFSGKDDDYNTIEGLQHRGIAGSTRRQNTDFGSGYQGQKEKSPVLEGLRYFNSAFLIGTAALTGYDRFGIKGIFGGAALGLSFDLLGRFGTRENPENKLSKTLSNLAIEGIKASATSSLLASSMMKGGLLYKGLGKSSIMSQMQENVLEEIARQGVPREFTEVAGFQSSLLRLARKKIEKAIPNKFGKILGLAYEAKSGSPFVADVATKYGSIKNIPAKEYVTENLKDMFGGAAFGAALTVPLATVKWAYSSAKDNHSRNKDSHNSIEGLPHTGVAGTTRKQNTDFGSGYQGLLKSKSLWLATGAAAGIGAFTFYGIHSSKAREKEEKYKSLIQHKFAGYAAALKKHGVKAGTGHKRILIPKTELSEKDIEKLGFEGTIFAIPETGQDRLTSYRNPNNPYHLHSHNDVWSIHKDRHMAITMSMKKVFDDNEGLATNTLQAIAQIPSGLAHVITEGVPGAYYYLKNKFSKNISLAEKIRREQGSRFSGKDDNYNTIEGLGHGGALSTGKHQASRTRARNTDFGSGYLMRLGESAGNIPPGILGERIRKELLGEFSPLQVLWAKAKDSFQLGFGILNKGKATLKRSYEIPVDPSKIKSRYKRLSSKYHPDRGGTADEMSVLSSIYKEIKDTSSIKVEYKTYTQKEIEKIAKGIGYGIGAVELGAFVGLYSFFRRHKEEKEKHNTIKGLPHKGAAGKTRKQNTDFGSGYQGLNKDSESIAEKRKRIEEILAKSLSEEAQRYKAKQLSKDIEVLEKFQERKSDLSALNLAMSVLGGVLTLHSAVKLGLHANKVGIKKAFLSLREDQAENLIEGVVGVGSFFVGGAKRKREKEKDRRLNDLIGTLKTQQERLASYTFSGKDDKYNTIEGLSHKGIAGQTRKQNTDFGSGYQGQKTKEEKLNIKPVLFGVGFVGGNAISASINSILWKSANSQNEKWFEEASKENVEEWLKQSGSSSDTRFVRTAAQKNGFEGLRSYMFMPYFKEGTFFRKLAGVDGKDFPYIRGPSQVDETLILHEIGHARLGNKLNIVRNIGKMATIPLSLLSIGYFGYKSFKKEENSDTKLSSADLAVGLAPFLTMLPTLADEGLATGWALNFMKKNKKTNIGKSVIKLGTFGSTYLTAALSTLVPMIAYKFASSFSGKDDDYNTIEGLRHGGMAEKSRKELTDFGSGWDSLRGLLRASETFEAMIAGKEFQAALKSATQLKQLGKGQSGTAYLMQTSFREQNIQFVRKMGDIGKHEVSAMRSVQETVGPSFYSGGKDFIDMEFFQGKAIEDIFNAVDQDAIQSVLAKLHQAGYAHKDIHLRNIMQVQTSKGPQYGLIDMGKATPLSKNAAEAAAEIKADVGFLKGQFSYMAADPFAAMASGGDPFANQQVSLQDAMKVIEEQKQQEAMALIRKQQMQQSLHQKATQDAAQNSLRPGRGHTQKTGKIIQ